MGKCVVSFKKVLFVFEEELTQCYIAIQADGDCPFQMQGWHHKTFPATASAIDIMELIKRGEEDPLLWPLNAPN